jgi:hypothetical protein
MFSVVCWRRRDYLEDMALRGQADKTARPNYPSPQILFGRPRFDPGAARTRSPLSGRARREDENCYHTDTLTHLMLEEAASRADAAARAGERR